MHRLPLDRGSGGASPLHARDARAKLAALLVFLAAVSTTPDGAQSAFGAYAALLAAVIGMGRLSFRGIFGRAFLIMPLPAIFAAIEWFSGERVRASAALEKSFLSALAAVILIAVTPLPRLVQALDRMGIPQPLTLVVQFVYRYLFVIMEQARRMRFAASSREGPAAGRSRIRKLRFHGAAGALGVLFARSWQRAEGIHRAMLARGFTGSFPVLSPTRFRAADLALLGIGAGASLLIRFAA